MTPQHIRQLSSQVSEEARPQLDKIAEEAATRHGARMVQLSQQDTQRLGFTLSEIQDQSFLLGVQLGIQMVLKLMSELQPPEADK